MNRFITSKRIKDENKKSSSHLFEIVEVVSRFDNNIKFDASNKLRELDNGTETSRTSEAYFNGTKKGKRTFDERIESTIDGSAPDSEKISFIANNEILRKRAKPRYLLKR